MKEFESAKAGKLKKATVQKPDAVMWMRGVKAD